MEGKCQRAVPSDLDLCGQLDMRYACLSMSWEFPLTSWWTLYGRTFCIVFLFSMKAKKQGWYYQSFESDQNSIQELTGDFMAHWLNDESFSWCLAWKLQNFVFCRNTWSSSPTVCSTFKQGTKLEISDTKRVTASSKVGLISFDSTPVSGTFHDFPTVAPIDLSSC